MIPRQPERLAEAFDLVVVGGGITGVCIAREAALRGLRVALVERGDYGSGTSSATTKYLHGGIRYLEQGDVRVVRESLRERRILSLAAPHLVQPTPFVLPVWSWSKPGPVLLGAGVALYDLLAADRNQGAPDPVRIGRARWRGPSATRAAIPWLDPEGLRGSWVIHDVQNIHPERLLLALLADAVAAGAVTLNHCPAEGLLVDDERTVVGVRARDALTGQTHEVRAPRTVNAAGPWMGEVLAGLGREPGVRVAPSKGVHVLTRPLGGPGRVSEAVMARTRSGRHVVVSPWQGHSFIGPTDTPVAVAPDQVAIDPDDIDALIDTVNGCAAPDAPALSHDDVLDATVGIRPLVSEPGTEAGADTYRASRRHALITPPGIKGLWSVVGGKWTTGRAIADDVLDEIGPRRRVTRHRPVAGAFAWADDHARRLTAELGHRPDVDLDTATRTHLIRLYGTEHRHLLELVAHDSALGSPISARPGCYDIAAQVIWAVTHESALTLADVVDRRLALGTLGPLTPDELQHIAALMAPLRGWTEQGTNEAAAETARRRTRRASWQRS